MPKETFLNLPKSKQAVIDDILLQTFCAQSISQVKVSQIVDQMGMSRGAFYKYFKITFHSRKSLSSVNAAFAGLVDGSFIASICVNG